jgi:hypothetical protein
VLDILRFDPHESSEAAQSMRKASLKMRKKGVGLAAVLAMATVAVPSSAEVIYKLDTNPNGHVGCKSKAVAKSEASFGTILV